MNITFLIGNGFDLNLGMKTKYEDFYNYYKTQESSSNLVKSLKNELAEKHENWADLEMALGEYTKKINSADEFETIYEDIRDSLAQYINNEENKYNLDSTQKETLRLNLISPKKFLLPADQNTLVDYKNKWDSHNWNVRVISFNYTKTLENLLGFGNANLNMGNHHGSRTVTLNEFEHIHGFANDRMILGVNDKSQIANVNFHNHIAVTNALVKPDCNRVHKLLHEQRCQSLIENSNLICLFGLSMGDTDKLWWELIGNRLVATDNCRLVIFNKGESLKSNQGYKLSPKEEKIKTHFLSKTNLSDEQKEAVKSKIFVGYNTEIFKIEIAVAPKKERTLTLTETTTSRGERFTTITQNR